MSGPPFLPLFAGSTQDVLARLAPDDVLDLHGRTRERVRQRALSRVRVVDKAIARIARAAHRYRGEPGLALWLKQHIDDSIDDALVQDEEEEAEGIPSESVDELHAHIAETLGVELGLARRACVVLNGLPTKVRRVFQAVAIEGKSIRRVVAEGHGPPSEVERRVKIALKSIALLRAVDVLPEDGRADDE